MENQNSTELKEQTEKSNDKPAFDRSYHRRYLVLPIALGIILLVIFVLMIGAVANHRGKAVVTRQEFSAGRMMAMSGQKFDNSNVASPMIGRRGLIGAISKIDGNTLTLHTATSDQAVVVSATTSFYKAGAIAKQSDLAVGQAISVRGLPNSSGQIAATKITIY
ncbi:MAG TPA: DUF5666 domain-containing protein [Candidatus Saccharimonadales bacterium]|nr:DUF5666 domain-containing protein [Candidatus Saccharimonadales bacterium]